MSDLAAVPLRPFTEPATVRLIPTAYIEEPALAPLADTEEERAILEEIEGLTSARRAVSIPRLGGIDPAELLTEIHGYGWTYINAAFCYTRATGNRFNGPDRGAWYATYGESAVATAQAEVSYHLSRELEATRVFENVTDYRELIAGFTTEFHDLSGLEGRACLDPDPTIGYAAGQELASDILRDGGNGVLYPSARSTGGRCLAAFRPMLVQNVRQGATWRFRWEGTPKPDITRA